MSDFAEKHPFLHGLLLMAAPVLAAFIALVAGRYQVTLHDVFGTLGALLRREALDGQVQIIVGTMRLPRIVLALLVGSGLAAAGAAFQSLFSNPLATPDTLGVVSGASLGAVVGLFFGQGQLVVQLLALGTGFAAVGITYAVSAKRGESTNMTTMVLAGIVVSSLFSALVSMIKYIADTDSQLPSITYWLLGSLTSATWSNLPVCSAFIVTGTAVLFLIRWKLNVLPLSEDEARATGINLRAMRVVTAVCSTMITAGAVAMCGQVAWVGLLIPHIARMLYGSNNARLVPACISFGAVFMVLVDTLARCMTEAEIPISILTSLIGAPFFIHLLRTTKGWQS